MDINIRVDTITTSIDELPSEMINELFKNLPPKDLIACSLVNKHWHSIYAAFKLHRLVVDVSEVIFRWYDSNRTIRDEERCAPEIIHRLAEKPLLTNLKYLALAGSFAFDLNKLNWFQQLEHLEIKIEEETSRCKVHLNLPRLQVLALYWWYDRRSVSIDCPLLSTLLYYDREDGTNQLEVKHPERIRKLETMWLGSKLAPFKNVQCLMTQEFEAINKTTLLVLSALQELQFTLDIECVFRLFFSGIGAVSRLKRTLAEFLDETRKLRGNDFRFRFAGLQVTKMNLDQIDLGVQGDRRYQTERKEYIYMKNYHLIEPGALDIVYNVDYTRLLSHVNGDFPRCFFQKFTGIGWVEATGNVQDADHFLWFLKSLRSLKSLELANTGLGQEFYDQLPASTCSLSDLYLKDELVELNFDFIPKLSSLSDLDIDQLSLKSLSSLVRSSGGLQNGEFYVQFKEERFTILKKRGSPKWQVEQNDQLLFETENPEEIVNFFDADTLDSDDQR